MVHIAHFVLLGCLSLVSRTILSLQYIEVFRDDFNGNTIDQSKWNRVNAPSTVNGELQYYVPDDTWQESGFAFLRAQKRCNYAGRDYTAGRLDTKDKFQLMYGEVEWRAKLPKGEKFVPTSGSKNSQMPQRSRARNCLVAQKALTNITPLSISSERLSRSSSPSRVWRNLFLVQWG